MSLTIITTVQKFFDKYLFNVGSNDNGSCQGCCCFVFVFNFAQVLFVDYYSYIPHFYYHLYFHYSPFYYLLLLSLKFFVTISFVIFISHLSYPQCTLFASSTWWCACSMSVTKKNTVLFIFHAYLLFLFLTLSKYTLHCCKFNIPQMLKFYEQ